LFGSAALTYPPDAPGRAKLAPHRL